MTDEQALEAALRAFRRRPPAERDRIFELLTSPQLRRFGSEWPLFAHAG